MNRVVPVAVVTLVAVVAVVASVGLFATPASADGLGQFSFEPSAEAVGPGETFTVAVQIRSTPQFTTGVYRASVVVRFDSQALDATRVENGTFLDDEKGAVTRTVDIDNDAGRVTYEARYDSTDTGVYGQDRFATVKFRVAEDAAPGPVEFSVAQSEIILTDGMSQRIVTSPATVAIEEGNASTTGPLTNGEAPARSQQSSGSLGPAVAVVAGVGVLALFVGTLVAVRRL